MLLRKQVLIYLVEKLENLLEACGSLNEFLDARRDIWDHKAENIWAALTEDVRDTHDKLKDLRGWGRVYFEESEHFWKQVRDKDNLWRRATWKHNVTVTNSQVSRYDDVWFSTEELVSLKDDVDARKKLWAEKMLTKVSTLEVDLKTGLSLSTM